MARWQLLPLGFSRHAIQVRLDTGRLHRLYRGVYAVGHQKLSLKARWMAAVLACGPDAVLSHRAAAALWDLRPVPGGPIDVIAPRNRRGQRGIRIHRPRGLASADRTTVDGIPVTTPYRTLLDYAHIARHQQLRLAVEAAERRDLLDGRKLDELIARSRGHPGLGKLKIAIAALRGPTPWTQSELERAFLALIREAGLAEPSANVVVEGFLVDYCWPGRRLVVEIDGYPFHKSRAKFESDRIQDTKLQLAGYTVLRVTQHRIEHEWRDLIADLRRLITGAPAVAAAGR